jgi:hypothetical protein
MRRFDPFRPRDALADAMGVLVPALLLTAIGLICVYSYASQFALKQALWAIVGVVSCIAVSRVPRAYLERYASHHPLPGLTRDRAYWEAWYEVKLAGKRFLQGDVESGSRHTTEAWRLLQA